MFSKNIPLNTMDFTGKRSDNLVEGEYYRRLDTSTINGRYEGFKDITFIPRTGPFYIDSMVLTRPNGELLIEGTHYEFFGIATALTAFVKDKEVGIFINMIDEDVTEWFASYQVVGHFGILNQDLVNIVNTAVDDDRPVYYKDIRNKPKWFNPELHLHDLRWGIHSFQDLVDGIKSIATLKSNLTPRASIAIEHFNSVIMGHIEDFESMLLSYIRTHDNENVAPYGNSHGLTAKQVELEKVDNFETATLLQIIDGFRRDKHVTVDLVKKAIDYYGVADDNLIKYGTLPILRYGSNSFIPVPISGSYEGMGGSDFNIGCNIETNGDALILMNRNDGRVNSLYFMENKDSKDTVKYDVSKWSFTTFQYTHQTAVADGVSLRNVIRGSDGKFLIIGGPDANGTQVWYYTLGNGTFNPSKHKLIRMPSDIPMLSSCFLSTETFPKRVLLFRRYTQSEIANNSTYRRQGFDTPVDQASFPGVNFSSDFGGLGCWEFDLSSQTWKRVTFNYNQAGYTANISSDVFMPFRTVITEITDSNPRQDGKTASDGYTYGLSAYEYKFAKPISFWNMRAWIDIALARYDSATDTNYLKYWYVSYGSDTRSSNYEGGYSSFGFVLKNRKNVNGTITYDIENRRSLKKIYTINTEVLGADVSRDIVEEGIVSPNREWVPTGYAGARSQTWLGSKRLFSMGSAGYGTFPLSTTCHDWNGFSSVENFDSWVDDQMNTNLGGVGVPSSTINYNETNPAGLTIGAHSTFWIQLNPNDPSTYGSVSFSNIIDSGSIGLWFRKQPALDSSGYPKPPTKIFNLYEAMSGNGIKTLGYDLDNTVYPITNVPETCFVSNIFVNSSDNRRAEYIKHLVGHQPFKERARAVTNDTAITDVSTEWAISADGKGYVAKPTKTYDLASQLKNTLIPYMESRIKSALPSVTVKLSSENALATMRISYCNLRGNKYNNLMLLSFLVFDDDADIMNNVSSYIVSMTFDLSGGTAGSDGLVTGATVTPVGNVVGFKYVDVRGDLIQKYARAGYSFPSSAGSTAVTQSRDMVMQLENGMSHVNIQWDLFLQVKGNNNHPGASYLISENGIVEAISFSVYWTAGQYYWFHHPYYGIVNRQSLSGHPAQRSSGPSEVGWPYPRNFSSFSSFTPSFDNWVMGNSNYLDGAFTVYFSSSQDILLNGRRFTIPSAIKNLKDVIADPSNKTFYVYLDYNGDPYYNISLVAIAESASRALISIIKTNNDSIYSIENYNVLSMNGIRISTVRHGSVIPAATGVITSQGQLEDWVTKNKS